MRFTETPLKGAFVIEPEPRSDPRGFFARLFCEQEFQEHGLDFQLRQANDSLSRTRYTLRGLHYQLAPKQETKLVRCVTGAVWDVAVDLRPNSATFGHHYAVELTAQNRKMMYVPKGFAHGFLTLSQEAEVIYLVDEFYAPELERGIRWNDPRFSIPWPHTPQVLSQRDQDHPDFDEAFHLGLSVKAV